MPKVKSFLFFLLLSAFAALFVTGCSGTDSGSGSSGGDGGGLEVTVRSIYVTPSSVTLRLNESQTHQITPTIVPSNAENKNVTYSSSNLEVAKVSETGLITPVKEGTAIITVTSVANPSATATVTVDVIASNPNPGSGDGSGSGDDSGNGGNTGSGDDSSSGGDTGSGDNSGSGGNDTGTDIKWDNLPSSPITGSTQIFDEALITPTTPVTPDNILALIGHYRIQYMTITDPNGNKIVNNIVGTGNNMRGEIAVNAVSCETNPTSCPVGLTIKMQYKSQFHPDIVKQGIPSSIEFIRKNIYSPLSSITDIAGEFAKLGAEIVEDTSKPGEYVVKFTLKSPDLPMPKGYTMQVTLKKIADDVMGIADPNIIVLDNSRYFSAGGSTGPVKVTGVTVTNKTIGLEVGGTAKLNYNITPLDAENKGVRFATYNENIATIDLDGNITAVGVGETEVSVITADGNIEDKATVIVVAKEIAVAGIEAGKEAVRLDINQDPAKTKRTADVKFRVTPSDATNKKILLKDGYDRNLIDATITNENGIATLSISAKLSIGTTKITVYAEDNPAIEKEVEVTVDDTTIRPESISLNKTSLTMTEEDTETLTATITPNDTFNKDVTWHSSDISVATVDNQGNVTAVGAGTATITVTTVDGGKTATCEVTVQKKHIAVTGIKFNQAVAPFPQDATDASVHAIIEPSDATNKAVKYTSSDPSKVMVDENTGKLTIVDTNSTSDYSVTITATSAENDSFKATIDVTITSNFVHVSSVSITNKPSLINNELKMGETYQPAYSVEPADADNKNVQISSSAEDILSYDAATQTFTAKKAGTATITVQSQSNNEKKDTVAVTVWEPADIMGTYNVHSLEIHYNGKTIKSSETTTFTIDPLDHKELAVSTDGGVLDITGKIHIAWKAFLANPEFDELRYRYFSHNENLTDRQNSKDKLHEKGFTFNADGSLTYEFPFVLGADDTLVYSAGSANKLIFTLNNKTGYKAVIAGRMRNLDPVDFEDPYSLNGTYDIVFFGTNTNDTSRLGLAKGVIAGADNANGCSSIYSAFSWKNDTQCGKGTAGYDIPNGDFAGKATVQYNGGNITVITKVGFIGNSTIKNMSGDDQYQYTIYPTVALANYLNTANTGTLTGRHVSNTTTNNNATYYFEQNTTYTGKTDNDLVLFTTISKSVSVVGTLYPDTRLVLRKVQGKATNMNPNNLEDAPFDKIKDGLELKSSGNI